MRTLKRIGATSGQDEKDEMPVRRMAVLMSQFEDEVSTGSGSDRVRYSQTGFLQ
jgi:hypothetical protein